LNPINQSYALTVFYPPSHFTDYQLVTAFCFPDALQRVIDFAPSARFVGLFDFAPSAQHTITFAPKEAYNPQALIDYQNKYKERKIRYLEKCLDKLKMPA